MFFKKKSNDNLVKIFTENKGISQIPEAQPRPAYHFFPNWFKNVPKFTEHENSKGTIKNCPVFAEYLTQGVVIPMWCDTKISVDENGNTNIESALREMRWEQHPDFQYLDFLPESANANNYVTLKAICPWFIKTPAGFSSYQNQMYYHFNDNYQILPGSIHTDYHHEINLQILVKKGTEFIIERGTPFAWYVPYKREKLDYVSRLATIEDSLDIKRSLYDIRSKFSNAYKERIKKLKN
jgi:hypothetical protein